MPRSEPRSESMDTLSEMDKLTVLIGINGVVNNHKKLKSLVYLLSIEHPKLFVFDWDRRFFGPQSNQFVQTLESAIVSAYLDEFLTRPENKDYPIHHGYKLTSFSYDWIKSRRKEIVDEFMGGGIDVFEDFICEILALNYLPTAIVLNEALRRADEERILRVYPDMVLSPGPSRYIRLDYGVHFDPERVAELKRSYAENGINMRQVCQEKGFEVNQVEVDTNKVIPFIERRYEYLRIRDQTLKKAKITDEHLSQLLSKIGFGPCEGAKVSAKAKAYLTTFETKESIDQADERLDFVLSGLKSVIMESAGKELGLQLKFYYSSAVEIIAHDDLKRSLKRWSDSYLLDLYHLFQPLERVVYRSSLP